MQADVYKKQRTFPTQQERFERKRFLSAHSTMCPHCGPTNMFMFQRDIFFLPFFFVFLLLVTAWIGNKHRMIRPRYMVHKITLWKLDFNGCLVNAFFFYFGLPLTHSISFSRFYSISSFAAATHIHWARLPFRSHTKVFQRHVEHRL